MLQMLSENIPGKRKRLIRTNQHFSEKFAQIFLRVDFFPGLSKKFDECQISEKEKGVANWNLLLY